MKIRHLLSHLILTLVSLPHLTKSAALLPRQDDQQASLVACSNGLPFICPSATDCVPTNAQNTSIICCPKGSSCNMISQITCDITQQNATEYPNNQVHSSDVSAQLPNCGSQCCPLGYNCAQNLCVQAPTPASSAPSSPSSKIPLVASPSTASAAAPSTVFGTTAPTPVAQPTDDAKSAKSTGKTIAIAVPLGVITAAIFILIIFYCIKRRRQSNRASTYLSDKKLKHSSSGTEFMGTTPRPLSLPQTYVAPLSSPLAHNRSRSAPHVPTVSAPIHDEIATPAPIARTDFLLRRGSVETGYEDKLKPAWSTRRKSRPLSLLNPTRKVNRSATDPTTPTSPRRTSRLAPLFSTPLRFGLPLSPSPAKNKSQNGPVPRPPRSDENLARLVRLEGRNVAVGEAKRISNSTPSPKRAKKCRVRSRSESARRPLVAAAAHANNTEAARPTSLERCDSDASATTIDSASTGTSGESEERGRRPRHVPTDSSETINVLLPPPSVFHTPPPAPKTPASAGGSVETQGRVGDKRETTFEEMMNRAGWRRSEWTGKS